ncbi:MAG: hypothetical protein BGO29_06335 [Bacteroidales bacterium 36-12]|nr:MAG: hypothetical protein BGO29_06335 [Bacteroidales bacterium 36-12]
MKLKHLFIYFFIFIIPVSAFSISENLNDSLNAYIIEDFVEKVFIEQDSIKEDNTEKELIKIKDDKPDSTIADSIVYIPLDIKLLLAEIEAKKVKAKPSEVNNRFYQSNPLFIDLVFKGYSSKPLQVDKYTRTDKQLEKNIKKLNASIPFSLLNQFTAEEFLTDTRYSIIRQISADAPYLVPYKIDKLPDVSDLINFEFTIKPIDDSVLKLRNRVSIDHKKLAIEKIKQNPWTTKSNALLQFSQNYISTNWYQGGSNNISILGIINGNFNYDNKKYIQWENFAEWRAGFNSVEGDTLRLLNTNDDVLRAISKLGIKAGGNWFYSGSVDFSTQLFNSFKAINSGDMKTTFLTPVRLNISFGLDYKYKKLLSLMVSPLSYKFIYANDTTKINQNSFGILKGEKTLSQIGSSFRAQFNYSPIRELQIDSRLNFYTNYEKIEVDWEIVTNFKFNRFLSTRLSINPRYDNTVLTNEKAKIQFKQLLTLGLSYRLL